MLDNFAHLYKVKIMAEEINNNEEIRIGVYVCHCGVNIGGVVDCPDVAEYAQEKLKELKDACYGSVSVTTLEFAMAIDKVENITADSYYSLTEARQVVSDFRSQSKHAMTILSTYKPRIKAAQSVESVDSIYEEAISKL